ncbi:MAG: hypothetical protein P4N59_10000 [Negativicutes bacterium]|nr:hypothetical protein [Negativicutes bacterium]
MSTTYTRPNVTDLSNSTETQGQFQVNATNLVGFYNQAHQLWTASTAYAAGNVVKSSALPNLIFECSAAGTSSASEPAWPTLEGQTVIDATVTWTARRQGSGGPMLQAVYLPPSQAVASAGGVLSIPASTNYVVANGTENITGITGASGPPAVHPAGSLIQIRWNTARILVNSAALMIQGGANRVTQAGDVGDYQFEAGGVVREVGYFPATAPTIGGGNPGVSNYIASGRKFSLDPTALKLDISAGVDYISGTTVNMPANNVTLPARSTNLVYDRNDWTSGLVAAAFPAADSGTVAQWILDGSANPVSTPVGNNLTRSGGITQVDGWIGYGAQGDGSSGYYVSANSNGFPIGAAARTLRVLWTCRSASAGVIIAGYGGTTGSSFQIYNNGGILAFYDGTNTINSGFNFSVGQTYLLEVGYDGANIVFFVNGKQVFKGAYSATTVAGVLYLMRNSLAPGYENGIIHYAELRNVAPTEQNSGPIANKLCLPCRYIGYSGIYPSIASGDLATYHEWRFSEISGSNVADSQGASPLTGTATGTTIVNSDIISGAKARQFNGTSDKITTSSYAFPASFTLISVVNIPSYTAGGYIVDNRNVGATTGCAMNVDANGKVGFISASTAIQSASSLPVGKPAFAAFSCNAGVTSFYVDSPYVDSVSTLAANTTAGTLYIGTNGATSSAFFKGTMDEVIFIPRALSQAEIAGYYKSLMNQSDRTIVDDLCPANSLLLGMAQAGSSAITSVNDSWYAYGRREGFGQASGNRRVFLGWKYYSGLMGLVWQNPFGTRKIRTYFSWAQDASGTNETDVISQFFNVSLYGVLLYGSSASRIQIQTNTAGVSILNGSWQTSGYIGCYAEVIE